MIPIKSLDLKLSYPFYFNKKINSETLRFTDGIDIEISDKIKKKPCYLFESVNVFGKENANILGNSFLREKSDLINLIDSSNKGISIKYLLNSYVNIKEDLLDIVKYKEKERILILIKGRDLENLTIYPFNPKFWVKNCSKLISLWHRIE